MNTEPNRYYAFLLRLWPENGGAVGPAHWRATLEDARSGERLGFASLEQLFAHLMHVAETNGQTLADRGASPAAPADEPGDRTLR